MAAPGNGHLRGVQERGRQGSADLVRESRRQLAHGDQALLPGQEDVHEMRFGHVREQHHLSSMTQIAARDIDESPSAKLRVLADGA
jgi:hypothetical protein